MRKDAEAKKVFLGVIMVELVRGKGRTGMCHAESQSVIHKFTRNIAIVQRVSARTK